MTLGSATMSQMNGWREKEHPLCNNPTLFPDQRNEWKAVYTKDKEQKTPIETMALGVPRRCIGLIAIGKSDDRIKETGPTSRQGYSELQEEGINVTTQDIFITKDIRGEIETTCNNFDNTYAPAGPDKGGKPRET